MADFAAIAGLELRMPHELGALYGVPFSEELVRPIVASIIGGYTSMKIRSRAGVSLLKSVPAIGGLSVSVFGASLTWAVGKVFIQHFASGGTFLDFNPEKVRPFRHPLAGRFQAGPPRFAVRLSLLGRRPSRRLTSSQCPPKATIAARRSNRRSRSRDTSEAAMSWRL